LQKRRALTRLNRYPLLRIRPEAANAEGKNVGCGDALQLFTFLRVHKGCVFRGLYQVIGAHVKKDESTPVVVGRCLKFQRRNFGRAIYGDFAGQIWEVSGIFT
jgi:hypothetical protein